jgi:hypothetical protein
MFTTGVYALFLPLNGILELCVCHPHLHKTRIILQKHYFGPAIVKVYLTKEEGLLWELYEA